MNANLTRLAKPRHVTLLLSPRLTSNFSTLCKCPLPALTSNCSGLRRLQAWPERSYCRQDVPANKMPPLMNFPEIVWPSLIKSMRNFILATFIIKPYFDRDFNLPDFVAGAKQALEVVSSKLAAGEVKALSGLVSSEIVPKLQASIALMSLSQREQIAINKDDIYFSFPYQVGVIFNDEEGDNQKRFVEITMVFHTMRGLAAMRDKGEEPPLNMGMMPEYQRRISICNYRFVREYTKGVESEWTVNLLNHFKPAEHLRD